MRAPAAISESMSVNRLHAAVGIELLAQPADEDFQHVGVAIEILLVDVLGEVCLRDQFAGVHHQVLEHLVFVTGEVDVGAVDADGLCGEIEHDRAAFEGGLAPPRRAAYQCVDARKQFFDMEGLDQVIVGALLEAFDLVLPARTRGEDQHRELLVKAFLAVLGGVHREAFTLQAGGQGFAQRGFVFDEQDTHDDSGGLAACGRRHIGCPIQSSLRRVGALRRDDQPEPISPSRPADQAGATGRRADRP